MSLRIGSCIQRSWVLYQSKFGDIFIATFLVFLASSVVSSVPYLGPLASLILNGIFYGGLYTFFLKAIRGQKTDLSDAFSGFQMNPGQLMLGGAVPGVLGLMAACIPAIPFLVAFIPAVILFSKSSEYNTDALVSALSGLGIISLLVCIAVGTFFFVTWIFTLPLIADKRFTFWDAMEASRKTAMKFLFRLLGLVIVSGLVSCSGILLCCVGIVLTIPIGFGAIVYAYEDLMGGQAGL